MNDLPNTAPDGEVHELMRDRRYVYGVIAIRYVELGRGLCTAFVDQHEGAIVRAGRPA